MYASTSDCEYYYPSMRKRATAADKVSSSVNYVHVKRIASIPCGHISYLLGPLVVAITLEPLDIPTRIATILYLDYPLSLSHSLVAPISPFYFLFRHLSLSLYLSSLSLRYFATSFPINIYALTAFPIF